MRLHLLLASAVPCILLAAAPAPAPTSRTCPCNGPDELTGPAFQSVCQALGSWAGGYTKYQGWPFYTAETWQNHCRYVGPGTSVMTPITPTEYEACRRTVIDAALAAGVPCSCALPSPDVGSCTVAGQQGVCAEGVAACTAARTLECRQVVFSTPEVCDNGLDDDCDGATDGADPDCSGGGGACAGLCGGLNSAEGCFCDALCDFFGDCCAGICTDCGGLSFCTP